MLCGKFFCVKNNNDDILLLNLIREGDELAFRHLFETYFRPLCRFMYVYISDKEIVEEMANDIFIYVWENRKTLLIQHSFKSYLFQAARNRSLNALRQKKKTISLDEANVDVIDTEIMSLEHDELHHLIQEAVFTLPKKCKEVFNLSRNENLSNQKIAEELNISVKTVEGQITKALKRIRGFLKEAYL